MSREEWRLANPALSECRVCGMTQGCGCELGAETQAELWQAFCEAQHAKGRCEFSGQRVTQCQRTICDCGESPEGAVEIERRAGIR